MGSNQSDRSIDLKRKIDIEERTAYTGNNSFIVLLSQIDVYIYIIDEPNNFKKIQLNEKMVSSAKMHPFYKTIFLTIYRSEIKIWEISKSRKDCKLRIKIKGHTQNIIGADFCRDKNDDKLLSSYSEDNTIKIWNLEKAFCINSISTTEPVHKVQLYSKYLYYQKNRNIIILYDNNYLKEIKKFDYENKIIDFVVTKEKEIIILTGRSILIYNFDKNTKQEKLSLISFGRKIIYDNKLEILYIISKDFIYVINKNSKIFLTSNIENTNVILLDNAINNDFICAKFLIDSSKIYYFKSKELYDEKKIVSLNEPPENFWKNCISSISDIINISWDENDITKTECLGKKYLDIKEIKTELEENYKFNLDEKKEFVKIQLNNYSKSTYVREEYLQLLKMVIKDNTNKDLIKKYLLFIKSNEKELQAIFNEFYETYEKESQYYSILFTQDNSFKIDKTSQKNLFISLLTNILNIKGNNIDTFHKGIQKELDELIIFNQPITYDNKELYWHRNAFIIYFSLKNLIGNEQKLELMKLTITEVFKRNLLTKDYILEDKILLTSIITLIAIPQQLALCQFNLNLIETKDKHYNYKDKLSDKYLNEDIYEYHGIKLDKLSQRCIENFVLNIKENEKEKYFPFKEVELYNYNSYYNYFNAFINIKKINIFLSKIFCSNTFKDAFSILYPSYFKYPFKDEKEALNFIQSHFNYIPFKSSATIAVTDKFSLESYYFLKLKKIFVNQNNISSELKKFIEKILYHGSVIKTNTHEINHQFYNILFLHSNGYFPVETPRKKKIDERESGKNLEILLFNRRVRRITLEESLYILNEKNYEKNLGDFRTGFNELKTEDITIGENGIFSEFNDILKETKKGKELLKNCLISTDDIRDDEGILSDCFIDNVEDENDVLGFIRNI